MKTIIELYQQAEASSIRVDSFQFDEILALSYMNNSGECYIGIDYSQINTKAEEKTVLGHELGHCATGSFYNRYSPCDIMAKHGRRADKRAALELVPIEELAEAIKDPWNSVYDLAEHFEVTEDFMRKVIEVYREGLMELIS